MRKSCLKHRPTIKRQRCETRKLQKFLHTAKNSSTYNQAPEQFISATKAANIPHQIARKIDTKEIPFSTNANFSEKLRNISFLQDFTYLLNG